MMTTMSPLGGKLVRLFSCGGADGGRFLHEDDELGNLIRPALPGLAKGGPTRDRRPRQEALARLLEDVNRELQPLVQRTEVARSPVFVAAERPGDPPALGVRLSQRWRSFLQQENCNLLQVLGPASRPAAAAAAAPSPAPAAPAPTPSHHKPGDAVHVMTTTGRRKVVPLGHILKGEEKREKRERQQQQQQQRASPKPPPPDDPPASPSTGGSHRSAPPASGSSPGLTESVTSSSATSTRSSLDMQRVAALAPPSFVDALVRIVLEEEEEEVQGDCDWIARLGAEEEDRGVAAALLLPRAPRLRWVAWRAMPASPRLPDDPGCFLIAPSVMRAMRHELAVPLARLGSSAAARVLTVHFRHRWSQTVLAAHLGLPSDFVRCLGEEEEEGEGDGEAPPPPPPRALLYHTQLTAREDPTEELYAVAVPVRCEDEGPGWRAVALLRRSELHRWPDGPADALRDAVASWGAGPTRWRLPDDLAPPRAMVVPVEAPFFVPCTAAAVDGGSLLRHAFPTAEGPTTCHHVLPPAWREWGPAALRERLRHAIQQAQEMPGLALPIWIHDEFLAVVPVCEEIPVMGLVLRRHGTLGWQCITLLTLRSVYAHTLPLFPRAYTWALHAYCHRH